MRAFLLAMSAGPCALLLATCTPAIDLAAGGATTSGSGGSAEGPTSAMSTTPSTSIGPGMQSGPSVTIGSGSESVGSSGVGGSPPATQYLYSRTTASMSWTKTALAQVWGVDANAPPVLGITAVAKLQKFDDLWVFANTANGSMSYRRLDGTWRVPKTTSQRFPTFQGGTVDDAFHVPYWQNGNAVCGNPPNPAGEALRLVSGTTVYSYEDLGTAFLNTSPGTNPYQMNQPPYASPGSPIWTFEVSPNPALCGNIGWWTGYALFGSKLYYSDGSTDANGHIAWFELPAVPNFIAKGVNDPDFAVMTAAYYDHATNEIDLIGP